MKKIIQQLWRNAHIRRIERWTVLLAWLGGIFYLSSQPNLTFSNGDIWEFIIRKIGHAFVFGMLAFLIYRILGVTEKRNKKKNIFFSCVFAILYALSDEYHQTLIPGRHGALADIVIDGAGIMIAAWMLYMNYLFSHHKPKIIFSVTHDRHVMWDV